MIGYIGGKTRLAAQIVRLLPAHATYVEPFCGMARVLFAKPPGPCEILNDISHDVVNYMRVCQLHHQELRRYLRHAISSRRLFEEYERQDPAALTDVQRAARFVYLQRFGFGGRVEGRTYATHRPARGALGGARVTRALRLAARRLERVQLECRPYEWVLGRFDRDDALFYCDPPYAGTGAYPSNFAPGDYARLAERLSELRGRFLLSINDHPLARSAFGRFERRELTVHYSVSPTSRRPVRELVFANYELGGRAIDDREPAAEGDVDNWP